SLDSTVVSLSSVVGKIVEFLSTFDGRNKPTRSCATTCPCLTRRATIFWRDFPSLQNASTAYRNPPAAHHGNPLQLLFNVGTTLKKHFVNPLSQVHQCFNAHL